MTRNYRKYDEDFKQGAVALVVETGKPIAQVARELGVNEGTLGNWCAKQRRAVENGDAQLSETERESPTSLRSMPAISSRSTRRRHEPDPAHRL